MREAEQSKGIKLLMSVNRLPPLEWVRAFEAAARLGSFTAAAQETGLTQASISQRINQLEHRLGVTLFQRNGRAMVLTVEGEAWLPHVRRALKGLIESTEAVFGSAQRRLTVSACQSMIDLWLMPRLNRLRALTHTEISVRTVVVAALEAPEDDVIHIRYGAGDWPHRYRVQLFREELVPVAAPALASQHEHWTALPRITCAGPQPGWHAYMEAFGIPDKPIPQLRFDTHISALGAARSGLGVFLASLPFCARDLANGMLVRLGQDSLASHESYWMLAGTKALSREQWNAMNEIMTGPCLEETLCNRSQLHFT